MGITMKITRPNNKNEAETEERDGQGWRILHGNVHLNFWILWKIAQAHIIYQSDQFSTESVGGSLEWAIDQLSREIQPWSK